MATDIASGAQVPTNELPVRPVDASATPATLPAAVRVPVASGPASAGPLIGGTVDGVSYFAGNASAMAAECAAAQASAQGAEMGRREHYQSQLGPFGGIPGDDMTPLPRVPEDASGSATPPAGGYLYGSGQGDQPGRGDAEGGPVATGFTGLNPA